MEHASDRLNSGAALIDAMVKDTSARSALSHNADAAAELTAVLHGIRNLGSDAAPTPSAALALLLSSGLQVNAASLPHRPARPSFAERVAQLPRRTLALGALTLIVLGASGGAAYANDGVRLATETAIANAINSFTPFHVAVPKPAGSSEGGDGGSGSGRGSGETHTGPPASTIASPPATPTVIPTPQPPATPGIVPGPDGVTGAVPSGAARLPATVPNTVPGTIPGIVPGTVPGIAPGLAPGITGGAHTIVLPPLLPGLLPPLLPSLVPLTALPLR